MEKYATDTTVVNTMLPNIFVSLIMSCFVLLFTLLYFVCMHKNCVLHPVTL